MNILDKLKAIFQRNKKEVEEVKETPQEIKEIRFEKCFMCDEPIYVNERWSKQAGKHFHKKCYKDAMNMYKNGELN